ncbi:MAG: hypothetical protein WA790_15790 [Sulfitobacter sp.]
MTPPARIWVPVIDLDEHASPGPDHEYAKYADATLLQEAVEALSNAHMQLAYAQSKYPMGSTPEVLGANRATLSKIKAAMGETE